MSTDTSPPTQEPYWPGQPRPKKPYWPQWPPPRHQVLWIFVAIQVFFLGWVIYTGVSDPQKGLGLPLGLWAVTFVIICAIYLIICQRTPR